MARGSGTDAPSLPLTTTLSVTTTVAKRVPLAFFVVAVCASVLYWNRTELLLRYARHSFPAGWTPRGRLAGG